MGSAFLTEATLVNSAAFCRFENAKTDKLSKKWKISGCWSNGSIERSYVGGKMWLETRKWHHSRS